MRRAESQESGISFSREDFSIKNNLGGSSRRAHVHGRNERHLHRTPKERFERTGGSIIRSLRVAQSFNGRSLGWEEGHPVGKKGSAGGCTKQSSPASPGAPTLSDTGCLQPGPTHKHGRRADSLGSVLQKISISIGANGSQRTGPPRKDMDSGIGGIRRGVVLGWGQKNILSNQRETIKN